ncbi:MAG: L-threonylcarbamoyladenylate synthase [Candidatus Azotimanducaceae bacterium]|jgi:L-threonylcarbamoyladenylate synthase
MLREERGFEAAVQLLNSGECLALPTETVYGLAAIADNTFAVRKIFAAKKRPADHPLIVHLPSTEHMAFWAEDIPDVAYQLANQFWPGPLTLLLKKRPDLASIVTGGKDTVAVRVPSHPLFLRVLQKLGKALAAPSANLYKQLSPTTAEQVMQGLSGRIVAVLDGGPCEFGLESTILDLVSESPAILRAGPISRRQIESVLGAPVQTPASHDIAVPGNIESHYQPNTPLQLMSVDAMATCSINQRSGYLVWSSRASSLLNGAMHVRELSEEPVLYGRELYHSLYELDQLDLDCICVETPPTSEKWMAVNDRLQRAAN